MATTKGSSMSFFWSHESWTEGYYKNPYGETWDLSNLLCPGEGIESASNSSLRGRTNCYVQALTALAKTTQQNEDDIMNVARKYPLAKGDIDDGEVASEMTEIYRFWNTPTDSWEVELNKLTCQPVLIKFIGDLFF